MANVKAFPLNDEFDTTIDPVDRPRQSFFTEGSWINFMRGIDKGGDGVHQTFEEVKETLGISPPGSAAFFTQEAKKRQAALKDKFSPEADIKGAEGTVIAGEVGLAVGVPLGRGKAARTLLGGVAGSTIFNEESSPATTALQVSGGALLGRLFGRGKAKLDGEIAQTEQKILGRRSDAGIGTSGGGHIGINAEERAVLAQMNTRNKAFVGPQPLPGPPAPNPRPSPRLTLDELTGRNIKGLPPQIAEQMAAGAERRGIEGAQQAASARRAFGLEPQPGEFSRKISQGGPASFKGVARGDSTMTRAKAALQQQRMAKVSKELGKIDAQIAKVKKTLTRKGIKAKTIGTASKKLEQLQGTQTAGRAILKELLDRGEGGTSALARVRPPVQPSAAPAATQAASAAPKAAPKVAPKAGKLSDDEMREQIGSLTGKAPSDKATTAALARMLNVARDDAGKGLSKKQKIAAGLILGGAAGGASAAGDEPGAGAGVGMAVAVGMLGVFGGPSLVRALSKASRRSPKAVEEGMQAGMRDASREGGTLNQQKSLMQKMKDYTPDSVSEFMIAAGKTADKFLGSIETRLRLISPKIADALNKMEFRVHSVSGVWLAKSEKAFKELDRAKLTGEQAQKFNIRLMNNRDHGINYLESLGHKAAAAEFRALGGMLDDIGVYLGTVNLGKGLRKGYFPRQVEDISAFENIKEVNTYLEHLAKVKKIDLTDYEKQNVLTDLMNEAVSRRSDQTFGRAAKSLKRRTAKVTEKTVGAYTDSRQAINNYIEDIVRQVERRKFFKGQNVSVEKLGPQGENIESIASTLAKGLGKTITSKQADEVAELIRARFGPGEQASSRGVQNFKNFTYAGLLGNPIAAITQLGDLALSAHRNGIFNTTKAIIEQLAGKGKLSKHRDLGLRDATVDFASKVASRDVLEWALKYSGFKAMDKFGKNVFINAAMKKNAQMGQDAFRAKWAAKYDPEGGTKRTDKMFNDVQNFEKTGLTDANREDIGLMAWNELAGVQPIGLSSLPQKYLENPNGRMAYMLQTFTLKLFDVMRKDIGQQVAAGNLGVAAKNTAKLVSTFVLLNAGADAAKNFLTGKTATVPELLVNNLIKMSGANKFMLDTAGRQGLGPALASIVMPPMAMVNALIDPKAAVGLIPVVGRNLQQFVK